MDKSLVNVLFSTTASKVRSLQPMTDSAFLISLFSLLVSVASFSLQFFSKQNWHFQNFDKLQLWFGGVSWLYLLSAWITLLKSCPVRPPLREEWRSKPFFIFFFSSYLLPRIVLFFSLRLVKNILRLNAALHFHLMWTGQVNLHVTLVRCECKKQKGFQRTFAIYP